MAPTEEMHAVLQLKRDDSDLAYALLQGSPFKSGAPRYNPPNNPSNSGSTALTDDQLSQLSQLQGYVLNNYYDGSYTNAQQQQQQPPSTNGAAPRRGFAKNIGTLAVTAAGDDGKCTNWLPWLIALGAVEAALVLAVVVGLTVFVVKRRKEKRRESREPGRKQYAEI